MYRIVVTAIWAIVLATVAVVSGATGYKMQSSSSGVLSYLNALSAGVILSAAFTHLLADATEDLEDFSSYPVAPACALSGFLLLVCVETLLTFNTTTTPAEDSGEDIEIGVTVQRAHSVPSTVFPIQRRGWKSVGGLTTNTAARTMSYDRATFRPQEKEVNNCRSNSVSASGVSRYSPPNNETNEASKSLLADAIEEEKPVPGSNTTSEIRTGVYSFWIALVVHSVMEGFAIGVTGNFVEQFTIAMAIIVHKVFASIALASALMDAKCSSIEFASLYGVYALASPCGAIVACFLDVGDSSTVPGIITGLAAGSFMYIGTMEMLPHMLSECKNMVMAMSLFVAAAVAMALLAAVV
mmetsp:Transcript_16350/g.24650  ORF Transcript_16350/g.24650 Transcript_16350/m.24650 type:complete len:354 (+) Transcript_16350:23-1084(+)|eukprot:CAMPEP_0185018654 /NCGR_PEP_ID=MMETSP1103-20130426/1309_1 /TAXON_ID=36769 /ORGANISM="Paraphysomonas bandaiensis, Strain Caron Lab Isolate" /LENGTH=353 /DNA_ID=CAMNT_0027548537 /DNA_START=23 /DNA_END=1084 /DNA_ORIENTATION=-